MVNQYVDAERVRKTQRENWTVAAPGWALRHEEMSAAMRPVTERLIAAAGIKPGDRVLDLACGVGDPAFSIASLVGAGGSVLGLDITPAMVEAATARAHAKTIGNASFRVISSELELGVPPASFDDATCRFGLMFMADPAAGLRSLATALKPGGRVAVSTWGPPERVPFFSVPNQIVGRHVPPPPDPDARGPFTLPTREALIAVLHEAGFVDINIDVFEANVVSAPSPDAYWDEMSQISGMMGRTLAGLSESQREAIRADAIAVVSKRFPDGQVRLGGEALIGSGVKPK